MTVISPHLSVTSHLIYPSPFLSTPSSLPVLSPLWQLSLAKVCSSGNPLGLEPRACADLVAQLFHTSPQTPRHGSDETLRPGIKDTMR